MRDKLNDPARLALMMEAITNIESFCKGVDSFESFAADKILCHAVTYNLQCIGENVYRLSKAFILQHPAIDWEAIEGMRHILVHDYYQVNFELIWQVIVRDLPTLKKYLTSIEE